MGWLRQIAGDFFSAASPFHQCVPDLKPNRLEFAAQLMIPEAQDLDPSLVEKLVPFFIPGASIWEAMSAAVELDGEFRDRAVEIQEVAAAGILAAKFVLMVATELTACASVT